MLTMDLTAEVGFIERFCATCKFAAALYTTHGHIPAGQSENHHTIYKRYSVDEYAAIARYYAAEWATTSLTNAPTDRIS